MKSIPLLSLILGAILIPFASDSLQIGEISVAGNNRLEWWQFRKTKNEVFDNRFDIDAYYGSFLLGFRYHVVEPSNVNLYERREGFYRRYIEYDSKNFGIRAGNYYTVFGRGLVLRAYEDDIVCVDRDLDGVKIRGSTDWGDLVAISGKPRNVEFPQLAYAVTNDTNDVLRGADLSLHPLPYVGAGASYVLLTKKDPFDLTVFRRTEVYGANLNLSVLNLDLYGEVAKKWGYDPLILTQGTGYGIYGSASLSFPGYGIAFQFADYDSVGLGDFLYRYNNPPVLNKYGQSINGGLDEVGYQVESYLSPIEPLQLSISYSDLETADDTLFFKEVFAEASYEHMSSFSLRGEYDRIEKHGIQDRAAQWEEDIPALEATYYITPVHSLKVGYDHRMVSYCSGADSTDPTEEFTDKGIDLGYTFAPYVTITLAGELRDKEVMYEAGKEWRSVQIDWDVTQEHRLTLFVGTERGGFPCSGGVCRYEPPFDGVKAILTSRF